MAINVKITGDAQNATNAIAKMEAKVLGLEAKLKQTGKAGKKAGASVTKSFDATKLLKFAGALVGVSSIAVGLRTVIRLFDDLKQKAKEAAELTLGAEPNLKRLLQISGGDPLTFAGFKDTAAKLSRDAGIKRSRALGIVFEAVSLGFTNEDIATFGGFGKFTTDVPSLVGAVGGIRAAFGEKAGGGSIRSIVNSLLAAAGPSKVGVEQIAGQILTPAQIVKKTGGTFEETAAAIGVMAVAVKSVDEASVQIVGLAKVLGKAEETKGQGLIAGVRTLLTLPMERQEEIAGRELRASKGFGLFTQNLDKIVAVQKDILEAQRLTGTAGSEIALALKLAREDPELLAIEAAKRSRASRETVEQRILGVPELQIQAIQDLVRETLVKQGRGAIAQGVAEKFLKQASKFTDDPQRILDLGAKFVGLGVPIPDVFGLGGGGGPFVPPTLEAQRAAAKAIAERAEVEAQFKETARLLLGSSEAQERSAKALERSAQGLERATTGGPALGAPTDEMSPVVIGGGT